MIRELNALGDRLLNRLLPRAEAQAATCRGSSWACSSGCTCYCYRWGDRSQYMRRCESKTCTHLCYDCC
jgi:hypothetical protein